MPNAPEKEPGWDRAEARGVHTLWQEVTNQLKALLLACGRKRAIVLQSVTVGLIDPTPCDAGSIRRCQSAFQRAQAAWHVGRAAVTPEVWVCCAAVSPVGLFTSRHRIVTPRRCELLFLLAFFRRKEQ